MSDPRATPDIPELEPRVADMLAAYRDEQDIPSDVKARVLRRLEAEPAVLVRPVAKSHRALWIGGALAAAVAALVIAPRIGSRTAREQASSAEYQDHRPPAPEQAGQTAVTRDEAATPREFADPSPDARDEADDPAPTSRPRRRPTPERNGPSERPPIDPVESLAAETALLREAQAALAAGGPKKALAVLADHRRRFPAGVLTEERRALGVVALCEDGQLEQGRRQAKAFAADYPASGLRERVAMACPDEGR